MKTVVLLTLGALSLAACNSEPEAEVSARNASVEEVAQKVREATGGDEMFVRPGKWQSKVTIEDISMPGMPAEMAEQMKAAIAQNQERSSETCLTEEQARRPKEEFFAGKNNACRYEHFEMGGGKIDAKMRCSQGGATQIMEMDGSYSPESYEMRMSTKAEAGQGPAGAMTMRMRVDSKRVGECDAQGA